MITLDYRDDKIDRIDPEVGTVIKLIHKDGSEQLIVTCLQEGRCSGCVLGGADGSCHGYMINCYGRIYRDVEDVLEDL